MKGRYSPVEQTATVSEWLLGDGGRRPSEAAMEVTSMNAAHLRKLHRNLRLLLDEGKLERVHVKGEGWRIRKPAGA